MSILVGFLASFLVLTPPALACEQCSEGQGACPFYKSALVAKSGPHRFRDRNSWHWRYLLPLPAGFVSEDGVYHERMAFEYHAKTQQFLLPGDSVANIDLDAKNDLLDFGQAACEETGLLLAGHSIKDSESRTKRYSFWHIEELGVVMHDRHANTLSSVMGAREVAISSDISHLNISGVICKRK